MQSNTQSEYTNLIPKEEVQQAIRETRRRLTFTLKLINECRQIRRLGSRWSVSSEVGMRLINYATVNILTGSAADLQIQCSLELVKHGGRMRIDFLMESLNAGRRPEVEDALLRDRDGLKIVMDLLKEDRKMYRKELAYHRTLAHLGQRHKEDLLLEVWKQIHLFENLMFQSMEARSEISLSLLERG